jgi:hypothetical protein
VLAANVKDEQKSARDHESAEGRPPAIIILRKFYYWIFALIIFLFEAFIILK